MLVAGDEYGAFLLCERDQVVVTRIGGSAWWLVRIGGQKHSATHDAQVLVAVGGAQPATRRNVLRPATSVAEASAGRRSTEGLPWPRLLVRSGHFGSCLRRLVELAPDRSVVGRLLGARLERDAVGENARLLLTAMNLDEVGRPERRGAPLIGASCAEEMRELEHDRDEVDRDQECQPEKLTSLGTVATTEPPPPANQAQPACRRRPRTGSPMRPVWALRQRSTVTSVPIGVYGQTFAAADSGSSTQPRLCGVPKDARLNAWIASPWLK